MTAPRAPIQTLPTPLRTLSVPSFASFEEAVATAGIVRIPASMAMASSRRMPALCARGLWRG